jgi:hypothetical protein
MSLYLHIWQILVWTLWTDNVPVFTYLTDFCTNAVDWQCPCSYIFDRLLYAHCGLTMYVLVFTYLTDFSTNDVDWQCSCIDIFNRLLYERCGLTMFLYLHIWQTFVRTLWTDNVPVVTYLTDFSMNAVDWQCSCIYIFDRLLYAHCRLTMSLYLHIW